ncbi:SDR family oxidoreductase, partial [Candidatus Bathyarchaeota archaeon]|nr:SDR family oxidoreductase [Candidatus Bathyarchaeota archaeon]
MRVLVTGHKGYIGSIMVPMLEEAGYEVVGLDNDFFDGCVFGDPSITGEVPDIPYVKKDIRDIERSDLQNCDAVIHLCALSNDPLSYFNPEITDEINHKASVSLAKLAKKIGVRRYIFSSTCSVYGAAAAGTVHEKSEPRPLTPYAVSK